MPELRWHWGYFTVWGVMITIVVGMLRFFSYKKWF
jgi:magnesium transporter